MTAAQKIWAWEYPHSPVSPKGGGWIDEKSEAPFFSVEYIRADLHQAAIDAALAREALAFETAAAAMDCACAPDRSDCIFMNGAVHMCYREGLVDPASITPADAKAALQAERDAAVLAERERCAAWVLASDHLWPGDAKLLADEIRKRQAERT